MIKIGRTVIITYVFLAKDWIIYLYLSFYFLYCILLFTVSTLYQSISKHQFTEPSFNTCWARLQHDTVYTEVFL